MGRRRPARRPPPVRADVVEEAADGDWVVRPLTGSGTGKAYRCPGCDQEIRPATPGRVASCGA